MNKKISMLDVKQALLDSRFRESLPDSLSNDVQKFLANPGCSCNHPLYRKIIQEAPQQLSDYFPLKEASLVEPETARNEWEVINCSITELQKRLRALPPGKKQLEIARFQDQVTVVINHLDS